MSTFSVLHRFNSGDLIAAMAGFKAFADRTDQRVVIYQQIDFPAHYYEGADHPVRDLKGGMVTMNTNQFDFISPLIEGQYYVHSLRDWKGEKTDFDLTPTRDSRAIPLPYGDLHWWVPMVCPQLVADFGLPWIDVKTTRLIPQRIGIAHTGRYFNHRIHYYFLKPYEKDCVFFGTKNEHLAFCEKWGLDIEFCETRSALELACSLRSISVLIANQCFIYNLAEAMKIPRILEYCPSFPHLHPKGPNGYLAVFQEGLEHYFRDWV